MYFYIIKSALISRLILFAMQCIGNNFIPDHDAGVFLAARTPINESWCNSIIDYGFSGFRRWDAEYFLHIAEHGYTYENTLAFYPLYPYIISYTTALLEMVVPESFDCATPHLLLLVGSLLNVVFFCLAAITLFELSTVVLGEKKKAAIAVFLFCYNPASIFFSAVYSESLFALLTFTTIWLCMLEYFYLASIPLALGIVCRSNGTINIGFLLYLFAKRVFVRQEMKDFLEQGQKMLVILVSIALMFISMQYSIYEMFCTNNKANFSEIIIEHAGKNSYVLAGKREEYKTASPWCDQPFASSYSYVQKHYWDVGFLNYYQWKQLPNFLLATPILCVFICFSVRYFKRNLHLVKRLGFRRPSGAPQAAVDEKLFVFVVHGMFLTVICILFVHIQVSTRFLASASPLLYWIGSQYFSVEISKKNAKKGLHLTNIICTIFRNKSLSNKILLVWFGLYFFIGTLSFVNFYPWT